MPVPVVEELEAQKKLQVPYLLTSSITLKILPALFFSFFFHLEMYRRKKLQGDELVVEDVKDEDEDHEDDADDSDDEDDDKEDGAQGYVSLLVFYFFFGLIPSFPIPSLAFICVLPFFFEKKRKFWKLVGGVHV